jgi:para-aminobenzoate synthetase/4-amino-4-deoxychorismate lyase
MDERVVVELDSDAPCAEVLRALADEPGLVCLWGSGWGSTVITSRPISVAADPAVLDHVDAGLGWFGWLGYDRPHRLALHDHLLRRVDGRWRVEMAWTPARAGELAEAEQRYRSALGGGPVAGWQVGEFAGDARDEHLRAVENAIGSIRDGELYQVNVCTRLRADFAGSSVGLFIGAVERLHPEYGAYVSGGDFSDGAIVSLSPELFLRRNGRDVLSSPIKGTRPRDRTDAGAAELRRSAKDAAENVMIVDLVRNDLGRVCVPGTVRARELLDIQAHPGVWHLVSSVGGTLREDVTDAALLAATFPPGSVTGAPKLRAMRAISRLEASSRGVYTGAVGFASRDESIFNVAIRTFEIDGGHIELGVGGGITVDSVPTLEWQETRHKALPLIAAIDAHPGDFEPASVPAGWQLSGGLLETMLAVDGEVLRLADHLARIDLSCRELYGAALPAGVEHAVREAAGPRRRAIRLTVRPSLEFAVSWTPAPSPPSGLSLRTAKRPGLWRHKWADRSWITDPQALFVAADGTVLETTFGNVFLLRSDGSLVTPLLREDLLPGVTRRRLLDVARDDGRRIELRGFTIDELSDAAAAFSTSSLSGLVAIESADGRVLPRRDGELRQLAARVGFGVGRPEIVS